MVKQVWDSKQALNSISSLVNAVPHMQRENVKNEVQLLLNLMNIMCLDTKETGNTLSPCFNVYADSSRMSFNKVWSCLRLHYPNHTYSSTQLGQGTVEQAPFRCTLCHGIDHPRGLCHFLDTPNWNGPTREKTGDLDKCRNMRACRSDPWGQRS